MGTQSNEFLRGLMPLDELGYRATIDIVHAKIHDGMHYSTSYYEKVGAGSAVNVLVTAPATGKYHFIAVVGTDGPGILTFSKAPNATASSGTAITAYNNDESSANDTALVHIGNGTYTSSGTLISTYVVGGSSGTGDKQVKVGAMGETRVEWELAPSSVHLLRWLADLSSCRTVIRTYFYKE
jgi:hypothetical protein